MSNVDKYIFWSNIQYVANNLDNLTTIRENNWLGNLCFKEDLNDDLKIIDNLLENKPELKIKLKKGIECQY